MNQNLEQFKGLAIQAHNWTSFSPERRGESLINEMQDDLNSDVEELRKGEASEGQIANYTERFKSLLTSWLHAKSRCVSSMIAGPSKFPVARAQKANRSEENHFRVFQEWRKKAKKSIFRSNQPEKTYETQIEKYVNELAKLKAFQENAKEINKIVKSQRKTPQEKTFQLCEKFGYSINEAALLLEPDFAGRVGVPSYRLTNNLANIKRIEDRIKGLEKMEVAKQATGGQKEFEFEGGVMILNYEMDRLQLKFPGKPSYEKISELKKNGFKWAPSQMAWQRQLTQNAIYAAADVTGLNASEIK